VNDITIIVKTMLRPDSIDRFLRSVYRYYPDIPVLVADDGKVSCLGSLPDNTTKVPVPVDAGLAACRNLLLKEVRTSLFVLCDDDFEFTPATRLEIFREIIKEQGLDILGGQLIKNGEPLKCCGSLSDIMGNLVCEAITKTQPCCGNKYRFCRAEMIGNFFMGHTQIVRMIGWDNQFKFGGEHQDFFLRCKCLKVGWTPDTTAIHHHDRPAKYAEYYRRMWQGQQAMLKKHGLKNIVLSPKKGWN